MGHWKNGRMADEELGSIAARCISFARQEMIAFTYDMVGYNDTIQVDHKFGTNPNDRNHTTCFGTSASWASKPGTASARSIFSITS